MDALAKADEDIEDLVRGGKRVRQDRYIHISLLDKQPAVVQSAIEKARFLARIEHHDFNVIRLSQGRQISFLHYTRFFEDPFPKLATACLVNLIDNKVRRSDFTATGNPPILHRKELLLPVEHPRRSQLSTLTATLEKRGLFRDSQRIGHLKQWESRLSSHGIQIIDNVVIVQNAATQRAGEMQTDVERHRTAIARDRLSAPMQALARHGLLSPDLSVLDYGCGQGDDVRALQVGGIPVVGWDPHFAPNQHVEAADIVNLGFVLNVIEEPRERLHTVRRAFELSKQCLAVAVMIIGKSDTDGHRRCQDGFITRRGTFQKYYRQEELKEFLDSTLRTEAIAVGPGIFFIFKDKLLEQRFFLERQRRIQAPVLNLRPPLDRPTLAQRRLEALRPVLERLWRQMLGSGRSLVEEELPPALLSEIETQIGSLRRAERLCCAQFDVTELNAAGISRKEDLLVYFALNLFNGRTRYSALVPELQRDIKIFFGNATSAFEAARALLFSVGKTEVIEKACQRAALGGYGLLFENHSLQIHSSLINRLPAALRCYAGCAAKLYGDIDTADLVKIHMQSGKLTLLFYNDFNTSPLPRLRERIKINMRAQRIDFFQHSSDTDSQLLYLKSRYMAPDQAGYNQQREFDGALIKLDLLDLSGYGPTAEVFYSNLAKKGYAVNGFNFHRVRICG